MSLHVRIEVGDALAQIREALGQLDDRGGYITDYAFWLSSQQALNFAANPLVRAMKRTAPRRTGALRLTINKRRYRARFRRRVAKKAGVSVGPDFRKPVYAARGAFYAPYVEYGHGGPRAAPAHPFVLEAQRRGLAEMRARYIRKFHERMGRLIARADKKINAKRGR